MPKLKKSKPKANLGGYAIKRKKAPSIAETPQLPDGPDHPEEAEVVSPIDDDYDEDLIFLGEDDVPLVPEANLLKWLDIDVDEIHTSAAPKKRGPYHTTKLGKSISKRREQELRADETKRVEQESLENARFGLKPTVIQDFFRRKPRPNPFLVSPPSITLNSDDDDNENPVPIPPSSSSQTFHPYPEPSPLLRASSRASSVSSQTPSIASSVPVSEFPSDSSQHGFDDNEDPVAAGVSDILLDIDDAPVDLMTSEELVEEGLAAFGVDLIDELGLDEQDDEEDVLEPLTQSHTPESSSQQSPPVASSSTAGPDPRAVKEWFVYADDSFNLRAEDIHTGKASKLSVPTAEQVEQGITNLLDLLQPHRNTGRGYNYKSSQRLGRVVLTHLGLMLQLLRLFKRAGLKSWIDQSMEIAEKCSSKGASLARKLRRWTTLFCLDKKNIPLSKWGAHNASILDRDEDLANDIHLHLQSLGKWVSADDVVRYVAGPLFQARLRVKKTITRATAQRWMVRMSYRWQEEKREQYSDGHERVDVRDYRQNSFVPRWQAFELCGRYWDGKDAASIEQDAKERAAKHGDGRIVVIWRHDESTFYAHDRRKIGWRHKDAKVEINPKGEGPSEMAGDFVSPDYGWLRAKNARPDGTFEDARVLHRAGKSRDGYQTVEHIIAQATRAMDILDHDYPDEQHVFAYDNATIHSARAPDALSAMKMTAGPSDNFNKIKRGDHLVQVRMRDTELKDGTTQCFYEPTGRFKGMMKIIAERREHGHDLPDPYPTEFRAECSTTSVDDKGKKHVKSFSCRENTTTTCCQRKVLYSEDDFRSQKTWLEEHCEPRGYSVILFPKYHPELNCIEQCWGYAKRIYRMFPLSSREDVLHQNIQKALNAVPLESIRRFAVRSSRFLDAYSKNLSASEAAWTNKKFRGHRTLPPDFAKDMPKLPNYSDLATS